MSNRKQWTAKEKFAIVMQGLSGSVKISGLCNEHGITQAQYYNWKNMLEQEGSKIFERGGISQKEQRMENEIHKLKETIGELHVELKKNDW
jgi:transposase